MLKNLKGDLFGGISSSIIALPLALAFGILAFAPLGPSFASQGALACLYGAILTSFFASLFGGTPTQITGPTAPMSVMIAGLIAAGLKSGGVTRIAPGAEIEIILTMVFFVVLLAGLFQILLGICRGGGLIKYIPYPVIAGFMNGIAMTIFLSQLKPFLGLARNESVLGVFAGTVTPSWVAITVGGVTILTVLISPRILKNLPGALIGMIAGLGCYFLIGWYGHPELLTVEGNPLIIGDIPASLPKPTMALRFFSYAAALDLKTWLALIIPALTLAMLGAIDSLLTSLVADTVTKTRHDSNRELMGQGIGNMIASLFGGCPGAGSTVRTLANYQNGGRTKLSGMFCGLTVFIVLMFLGQYARYIPYAVLAGILMVTATSMVDSWSFGLIRRRSTLRDMGIVVLVAGTTLLIDLMVAVGIGVIITILFFVRDQVTRSVVKAMIKGNRFHSKKVRAADEIAFLEKEGHQILVYQLEGAVFFGTADKLLKQVEKESREAKVVILDLKLIKEIDLTGAQIVKQLDQHLKDREKHLLLSYVYDTESAADDVTSFLKDVGALEQIGEEMLFPDTDRALEWAEDWLLGMSSTDSDYYARQVDVEDMKIFQYLSKREIGKVSKILKHAAYKAGDVIFREGDSGETMFLVSRGCVGILLDIGNGERRKRVASFGRGVFFGEMSLLENKPRSATAVAEEDTELLALSQTDFMHLMDKKPKIASKIQLGLARELSNRLRATSDEVRALEL